ncbi:hypothetical protein CSB37_02685 [bacterium DOLZORAL124_38_8]|nr:MAG: hypothetical protein CSB37_02685 [bacterium DOLZORAL124_38_8]
METSDTAEIIQKFCEDFGISFSVVVVVCGDTSTIVGHKIVSTLNDYNCASRCEAISCVEGRDKTVLAVEHWFASNSFGCDDSLYSYCVFLLESFFSQTRVLVTVSPFGANIPSDKKILAISRFETMPRLSYFSGKYAVVFSTEKVHRSELDTMSLPTINYMVGVETKLPKKLAKRVCEEILGQKVVMTHVKIPV